MCSGTTALWCGGTGVVPLVAGVPTSRLWVQIRAWTFFTLRQCRIEYKGKIWVALWLRLWFWFRRRGFESRFTLKFFFSFPKKTNKTPAGCSSSPPPPSFPHDCSHTHQRSNFWGVDYNHPLRLPSDSNRARSRYGPHLNPRAIQLEPGPARFCLLKFPRARLLAKNVEP